jgi:cytidylate kinase
VRATRRLAELQARGASAHYDDVLIDIRGRDERDAGRAVAPLARADDADLLDTSEMSAEQAIARAIALVEAKRG